jgi:hypothetical protein
MKQISWINSHHLKGIGKGTLKRGGKIKIMSHTHKQLVHYSLKEEENMHPFLLHPILVPLVFHMTPKLIKKALNLSWPSFVESKVVMKVWAYGFEEINLFWKKVHCFYYFYSSLILLLCAINLNLNNIFFQGSSKDKTDLLIVKFLGNLCVLYVLNPLSIASQWNTRVHNYVVSICGFVNKYVVDPNGCVFLFHDNDFGF